jgi:hypothetical protein
MRKPKIVNPIQLMQAVRLLSRFPTLIPILILLINTSVRSKEASKLDLATSNHLTKISWQLIHEVRKNV